MVLSKLFGYHWCIEEQIMLLTGLPFIGFAFNKLHIQYIKYFPNHKNNCHNTNHENEDCSHIRQP